MRNFNNNGCEIMQKVLGVLGLVVTLANPVAAQFVTKISASQEMKRLGTACVKFVEVGPVGMPDLAKAGYKVSKQGFGGKDFFAYKSLNSKKVDEASLPKGTGLSALVDWHNGRRNSCEFSVAKRTGRVHSEALKMEAEFHKLVRSLGYKKSTLKDKKGRITHQFTKGENRLIVLGNVAFGGKDQGSGSVKFTIINKNDASRKN